MEKKGNAGAGLLLPYRHLISSCRMPANNKRLEAVIHSFLIVSLHFRLSTVGALWPLFGLL